MTTIIWHKNRKQKKYSNKKGNTQEHIEHAVQKRVRAVSTPRIHVVMTPQVLYDVILKSTQVIHLYTLDTGIGRLETK